MPPLLKNLAVTTMMIALALDGDRPVAADQTGHSSLSLALPVALSSLALADTAFALDLRKSVTCPAINHA